jgi:hypothetical protein
MKVNSRHLVGKMKNIKFSIMYNIIMAVMIVLNSKILPPEQN